MSVYDQVWAVPGEGHIIDCIHPETGLTLCFQRDEASVLAEYPTAVRMSAEDWTATQAEHQHTSRRTGIATVPIWSPRGRSRFQN